MNHDSHAESAAEQVRLSRKRFLQRAGVAGAGAMLGGALSRADAAQNANALIANAPHANAPGANVSHAVASTRGSEMRLAQTEGKPPVDMIMRGAQVLGETDVRSFGAKGDGKTDDTAAFQAAIDEASTRGGGTVFIPKGRYFFAGNLNLPAHVTLRGVSEIADIPDDTWGSVLLVTAGKGKADGQPFILMARGSVLRGVTISYPEQTSPIPVAYPWTVRGIGDNVSILDCLFLNPYQAIDFATYPCGRHFIQNLYAHALYRGLQVDQCYDIGRVTNVHFWPFWSQDEKHFKWLSENAVAFVFGRTDWEYVTGCFTIFYKIGYHFTDLGHGPGNVLLLNSGADVGTVTAQVDSTQAWAGVSFVNAQMNGTLQVADTNEGPVKFTSCGFYAPEKTDSNADIGGTGRVSFDNCHFTWWDQNHNDSPSIRARNGHVSLSNCEFFGAKNHIVLERDVRNATIIGTHFRGTPRITNQSKGNVQLIGNTDTAPKPPQNLKRSFYSGFEANQPQPLLNKVEVSAHPGEYSLRLDKNGRGGTALFLRGNKVEKQPGTAYFRIFDGLKISITADTVLRYWIRADDSEARFCGIDLVFAGEEPNALRQFAAAKDLEDVRMHPAYPRGEIGKWVRIESPIGQWTAGKTITAILAAHDGADTAAFQVAFDDIEIGTAPR